MFGLAATFLAGPYGLLLKIGAIVAVIGAIWFHGRSSGVESMQPRVEAAESAAALWETTAKNRLTLIQAQNTAVEALRQAQATKVSIMEKKLATAILEGQKWRDAADRRADILANLELPPGECEGLVVLIDEARK